jgi:hypothetical protein
MNDPTVEFHRRSHARAVAMVTAARAADETTFNRLGQEAADEGAYSMLCWSFAELLDTALVSLSNVTGQPVEELLAAIGVAIAEEDR